MSASMAEVLAGHWSASTHTDKKPFVDKCDGCGEVILTWGGQGDVGVSLATHQAGVLAANGYGKLRPWPECAIACGACGDCLGRPE